MSAGRDVSGRNDTYRECRREEMHTRFSWGTLREGGYLEDPDRDGRIMLKWFFEKLVGGIDWIDQAQDRDRWRAVVNAVMNLRIP